MHQRSTLTNFQWKSTPFVQANDEYKSSTHESFVNDALEAKELVLANISAVAISVFILFLLSLNIIINKIVSNLF